MGAFVQWKEASLKQLKKALDMDQLLIQEGRESHSEEDEAEFARLGEATQVAKTNALVRYHAREFDSPAKSDVSPI